MRPRSANAQDLSVRIGDAGLFSRLLAALDLAPRMAPSHRARPQPGQVRGGDPQRLAHGRRARSFRRARHAGGRRQAGRARLRRGSSSRSPASPRSAAARAGEIAERFLEQAALETAPACRPRSVAIIERFLAHRGRSGCGLGAVAQARGARRVSISPRALDALDMRIGFIAALGVDVAALRFRGELHAQSRLLHRLRLRGA